MGHKLNLHDVDNEIELEIRKKLRLKAHAWAVPDSPAHCVELTLQFGEHVVNKAKIMVPTQLTEEFVTASWSEEKIEAGDICLECGGIFCNSNLTGILKCDDCGILHDTENN
jgi:hypothetical protein